MATQPKKRRALNQPKGGNELARFAGIASMMRLPIAESAEGLDACFVGIPLDIGTSMRSGTRFGPRQIRAESVLIRPYNMATGAAPFDSLQVADVGDIGTNPYSLERSIPLITNGIAAILKHGCIPLAMGGDHTLVWPVLRAIAAKHGPVALVHIDAHADVNDEMFGEKIAHGTPIRRAIEEKLIDPKHSFQIGLRGTGYAADDFDWARGLGVRVVQAEECWGRSLTPLMAEVRETIGKRPTYLTYDIDSLDPSIAPGTGTLEIGGLTTWQALEIIRGLRGVDLVGCDLVEVSPPYDPPGTTAHIAANLLYEMLCVLPGVVYRK
jgi:guanidinobutyrase